MSFKEFEIEYKKYFMKHLGLNSLENLSPKHENNLKFALSTNERGDRFLQSTLDKVGSNLITTHLDIGCAYGGACIAAAKRGIKSIGVDINEHYIDLAKKNAGSEIENPKFYNCSITDKNITNYIEPGSIDLFTINDVFEHVYDTYALMENLSILSSKNAVIYFAIPNGMCLENILSEGHTKALCASLANPFYWAFSPWKGLNIFYRRWDYFSNVFSNSGFENYIYLNNKISTPIDRNKLINKFINIRVNVENYDFIDRNLPYATHIKIQLKEFEHEFMSDIKNMKDDQLQWKYIVDFWTGIVKSKS